MLAFSHDRRRTVAAVQGTPVFLDREATIEKVAAYTKDAVANGAALVAFPEGFVPCYPDWVWRTTPWADGEWYARWADQSVDVPGPACDALGAIAQEHIRVLDDPGQRTRRRHDLQHDALLRARRRAAREASQARGDGRRTARVGHGRRLDALGHRHAVRARRRAHLLGELHAARARGDVRAGRRHLAVPDVGQLRRVGCVDAPHREGRPLLRPRDQLVPARRRRPRVASRPRRDLRRRRPIGCRAATP